MNKLIQWAACAAMVTALVVPATACEHVHKWSAWEHNESAHWRTCESCSAKERGAHNGTWQRTATEHQRTCPTCGQEEKGTHEDGLCDVCAEFRALAFGFVEGGDGAHADFANEANEWFTAKGKELGFYYDHTTDWGLCTESNLANYDIVLFLNNKPGSAQQCAAFKDYMENGGAWIGFHSSAFAMWDNGQAPSEWDDWYQNEFLGCGEYGKPADPNDPNSVSYWNTWNPTAEPMRVETYDHVATKGLLEMNLENDEFMSAPCEWYEWHNDLFSNPDIDVLLTMNPTEENPAGDDPRPGMEFQIWKSGCHPIAWSNKNYKMVYTNMGHNLMSYNSFEKTSRTFSSEAQNRFILDAMFGLTQK